MGRTCRTGGRDCLPCPAEITPERESETCCRQSKGPIQRIGRPLHGGRAGRASRCQRRMRRQPQRRWMRSRRLACWACNKVGAQPSAMRRPSVGGRGCCANCRGCNWRCSPARPIRPAWRESLCSPRVSPGQTRPCERSSRRSRFGRGLNWRVTRHQAVDNRVKSLLAHALGLDNPLARSVALHMVRPPRDCGWRRAGRTTRGGSGSWSSPCRPIIVHQKTKSS